MTDAVPSRLWSTPCPRRPGRFVNRRTGQLTPLRCDAYSCTVCGPRLAVETVWAARLARPDFAGVLTLVPGGAAWRDDPRIASSCQEFRLGLKRMVRRLRRLGYRSEHLWTVELSPALAPHAHLLRWGDVVLRDVLVETASRAGLGWAGMQPIRNEAAVVRYVFKLLLAAADEVERGNLAEAAEMVLLHRELNGRKLCHWSRGFFRDYDGHRLKIGEARTRGRAVFLGTRTLPKSEHERLVAERDRRLPPVHESLRALARMRSVSIPGGPR